MSRWPRSLFYSALWLSMVFWTASAQARTQEKPKYGSRYIELYTGVKHLEVLPHLPPKASYYGDYSKIGKVSANEDRNTLKILPEKPGVATINIHNVRGEKLWELRLDSRPSNLSKIVREVRGLLIDIEGISIKIVNNKVVIDGRVLLPKDLNRIFGVINQYEKGTVTSLVEINPFAQKKIAEIIERDINNPDVEVRAVNGKFFLQGVVGSQTEKETAQLIAESYVPPPVIATAEAAEIIKKPKKEGVINLLSIRRGGPAPPKKIIQIVVHYVELTKNYLNSSSFRFAPSIQDNTQVSFSQNDSAIGGVATTFTGIINNLLPKLNYAKQHGFGRILQSTTVVVQDQKQGRVSQNLQVPYIVRQPDNVNSTQFVNAQIGSTVTPRVINPRSDQIELALEFNVAALVGVSAAGPQTSTNNVSTTVTVRSGQSAAVGGLISNTSSTSYNPEDNGDALFNLNASKSFRKDRSQFVIFVTPIIKSSASAGAEKVKRKFRLRE